MTTAAIVGGGRTGRTLGALLVRSGIPVSAVSCRTRDRARAAAAFIGARRAVTTPAGALEGADLVLVCVPDAEVASVASSLDPRPGTVLAHVAGALGAEVLPDRPGVERGALHPLRSFADPAAAVEQFAGTYCAVEGSPKAVALLSGIVARIGGTVLPVEGGRKALYHAGAVFASNYVVAALDAARALLVQAGVPEAAAVAALAGLAAGSVENARRRGTAEALTGPVERGDAGTVKLHAEAIRGEAPEFSEAYAAMGRLAAALAVRKGSLDAAGAGRVNVELGGGATGIVIRPAPKRRRGTTTRRRGGSP